MTKSLLDDAFGHHVWATLRLTDACLELTPEQLETTVPGTYGSILNTMRHIVAGDSFDLYVLNGERAHLVDANRMGLAELAATMERNGEAWSRLLARDLDPAAVVREVDPDDGYQRDATVGIRLAGTLQHGTEHRSHVCTTFTALGVQPPRIDVFDFGLLDGRVVEVLPQS
ncbi:MAG TPA: DinB family protein [Dehalococcoidia bacterium]|nr:DinB family protein [Dehalococcoidia bacterium]